jgi:membrane-associated phospholipid phosphatase
MANPRTMPNHRVGAHFLAFGAYLTAMTGGLISVAAWNYAALFGAMLGALVWITHHELTRDQSTAAEQGYAADLATDLFFPIAINIAFFAMAGAVPALRSTRYDTVLFSIDTALFGGTASLWAERFISPALTDLLSLCYLFFWPLLSFSLLRYFFWQKERRPAFYEGLFTVYGVGFLGYLLVPAAGPYLAFPDLFPVFLDGGLITRINRAVVLAGSSRVDVFPSLHCAVSAYILGFSYRHSRRELWWLLLPVVGLWASTLYLRYHYLVDVTCGFLLAWLGLAIARRRMPVQKEKVLQCFPLH